MSPDWRRRLYYNIPLGILSGYGLDVKNDTPFAMTLTDEIEELTNSTLHMGIINQFTVKDNRVLSCIENAPYLQL